MIVIVLRVLLLQKFKGVVALIGDELSEINAVGERTERNSF
jgi:hypothetical protein